MVRRRIYQEDVCTHCPPTTKNTLTNTKDVYLTIGLSHLSQYFRNMSQVSFKYYRKITYPMRNTKQSTIVPLISRCSIP